MITLITILSACALSGILYRMGGAAGYNTKFRDLGCPTVLFIMIYLLFGMQVSAWWLYLLAFMGMFGGLTTYMDSVFGYDNFYAHGALCGLAGIPLIWAGIPIWLVLARLIICPLGMGLWSKLVKKDIPQEIGRGIFFIL